MLASITPLGERGRGGHWAVTVGALAIGAIGGGALIGAAAGSLGGLLVPASVGGEARLALLASAVVVAIALDVREDAVPGPSRQVDERWLDQFRGWVYGLGYGIQLGSGVSTVVSSAATYVALLVSVLVASPLGGASVMALYGAIRGLSPLVAARVVTPQQLMVLHSRLDRARGIARSTGLALMAGILAAAAGGAFG